MLSARALQTHYDRYLAALLTGDQVESIDFGLWLDGFWSDTEMPVEDSCLDDLDGDALRTPASAVWLEIGADIVGCLRGRRRGCYRVPRVAQPPPVALFLDDAAGCSTGSIYQERAFSAAPPWAHLVRPPADRMSDARTPKPAPPERPSVVEVPVPIVVPDVLPTGMAG